MKNELTIKCKKIEDRIKEQKLAERRGWSRGVYGWDGEFYFVVFSKFLKGRKGVK